MKLESSTASGSELNVRAEPNTGRLTGDAMAAERNQDCTGFISSPIVAIHVGRDYKQLLIAKSSFFEACLSSVSLEGPTNVVNLSGDDPDTFESIVNWMYTDRLNIKTEEEFKIRPFIMMYALAEKLKIWRVQNETMDQLRNGMKTHDVSSGTGALRNLKALGDIHSPLGIYLKMDYAWHIMNFPGSWFANDEGRIVTGSEIKEFQCLFRDHELTSEMFTELVRYAGRPWADPEGLEGCHFHVHPEGTDLGKCGPKPN